MSCLTKNNIVILFELVFVKSNHIYADIKYKSQTNEREIEFENFLSMLLSDPEITQTEGLYCR